MATDSSTATARHFLSSAGRRLACKQVEMPNKFDMTPLTQDQLNTTCGQDFNASRWKAYECMQEVTADVNSCNGGEWTEYYKRLCSECRAKLDDGMSSCTESTDGYDLINGMYQSADIEFDAICALGNTVSWLSKHAAIIIGFSVFGIVLCCLCVALIVCCCCCKKRR